MIMFAVRVHLCGVQSEETAIDEFIEPPVHHGGLMSAGSPPSPRLLPVTANISELDPRAYGSLYSDVSIASSFNPDNVSIERHPVILGYVEWQTKVYFCGTTS